MCIRDRLQSEPTGPFAQAMKAAQAQQDAQARKDITDDASENTHPESKGGRNAGKQKR